MFCEETKLLLASTLPTIAMQYGAEGFSHNESLGFYIKNSARYLRT
jgi:hypothetical protein